MRGSKTEYDYDYDYEHEHEHGRGVDSHRRMRRECFDGGE